MLQSLAEKDSTYSHNWGLRRVVFEPRHRYLFYSEVLTHIKEQSEVQRAIEACEDLHTVWKHKIKVTKITRDVQTKPPISEAALEDEQFDVRNLYILHVEGHRREIKNYEHLNAKSKYLKTSAVHAAYDGASPKLKKHYVAKADGGKDHNTNDHISFEFSEAVRNEIEAEEQEVSAAKDKSPIVRYTFRFLSQAVFNQWYEVVVQALEADGLQSKNLYCAACPKVDPRYNVPIARPPLHLVGVMHVLDQCIFYALLRGTRIVLDDSEHPKPRPDHPRHTAYNASNQLHLLRYQDASHYHESTFLLLTDNVVYFTRRDGKVVWTLNLIDVEGVLYNTTATPEPFIVFKNRAPLADLVFLVNSNSSRKAIPGYYDTTLWGPRGTKYFVDVLERLAPHAAQVRTKGEQAALTAPALKQKQQQTSPNKSDVAALPSTTTAPTSTNYQPFRCVGLNIYPSFEEFAQAEGEQLRWRADPNIAPSIVHGRASATTHAQVAPTGRARLLEALIAREKRRGELQQGGDSAALGSPPGAAKGLVKASKSTTNMRGGGGAGVDASPGKGAVLEHPHDTSPGAAAALNPSQDSDESPTFDLEASTRATLARSQSNIQKVILSPTPKRAQQPDETPPVAAALTPTTKSSAKPPQLEAPKSGDDLFELFSPKLNRQADRRKKDPMAEQQQQQQLPSTTAQAAAAEAPLSYDHDSDDDSSIVLDDSLITRL